MQNLIVFEQITLDGYFADESGDMSWAHRSDPEWDAFVAGNASGGGVLLFGRVTYEMMASFWPTPMAREVQPVVAKQMNEMKKVVFSRSLDRASWTNTTLVKDDLAGAVRRLKKEPGNGITVLGSGSIVRQLAEARLVDEYQLVVNPLVLGRGQPLFADLEERLALRLSKTRSFTNGNVLLSYVPAA